MDENENIVIVGDASAENEAVVSASAAEKGMVFSTDRRDLIMAGCSVLFSAAAVLWGLWGGGRLGWTLASVFIFAAGSLYFRRERKPAGGFAIVCGVLALALSSVFILTGSDEVRFLSFVTMTGLFVIYFAALAGRKIEEGDTGLLSFVVKPLLASVEDMPLSMRSLLSGRDRNSAGKVMLGILCAIPVLCVIIPLLSGSDAAFEGLLDKLNLKTEDIAGRLVCIILLSPVVISFFLSLKRGKDTQKPGNRKGLDTAFVATFEAVLSLCYIVYLFSQLAYFFSAFASMLPEGYEFSYSEYARRGFYEMCSVSAINLGVIFFALVLSKKEGELPPVAVRILSDFIAVFTLLLIGTAFSKMMLYIDNYGMSENRITTLAIMLFMAVVFIAVILRCHIKRIKILHTAVISAGLILLLLGTVNMNAFTARYNWNAWKDGQLDTLDTEYLCELGYEGVPYLVMARQEEAEEESAAGEHYYLSTGPVGKRLEVSHGLFNAAQKLYEGEVISGGDYTCEYTVSDRRDKEFYKLSLPQIQAYRSMEGLLDLA